MRIFTIGYEGTTQPEFIAALTAAGVQRVIDVRAVPLSRKPGFSKTILANGLAEAGIDYVHLKALGTPPEGREAARKGRHAELERIYAGQLDQARQGGRSAARRPRVGGNAQVPSVGEVEPVTLTTQEDPWPGFASPVVARR